MELNIMEYLAKNVLILIPVAYILGIFLKRSSVKDKLIPWILLVVTSGFCIALTSDIVQGLIQGVLVTGVCVLGNQLYIQSTKK